MTCEGYITGFKGENGKKRNDLIILMSKIMIKNDARSFHQMNQLILTL